MKLLSFEISSQKKFGAKIGNGIVDLTGKVSSEVRTLRGLFDKNLLAEASEFVFERKPDFGLDEVKFLLPIPDPEKIICVGVNYGNRNAEYKDGSDQPKWPSIFPRFPGSFVGHSQNILRPLESLQLDYEGEIAIIIGKTGRRIPRAEARSYIAGLTCVNEGTIRDWTKHGKFNVTQGKNFDASGAIGPWMVTPEEFNDFENLRVITRVNDETRQDDNTKNLIFPFDYLINYISIWTTLKPGDIISTGTPIGAGVRFDPPRFLQPGDKVEVEVEGIGILENIVAGEAGL
jgi:2-keto-4-pentenoate hydratase/2-oxohepta-3-ene-1,7-dioic acid hydratase in catechol pathway